ncbi:hypothetical protein M0R72_16240 [Candidatus Pacearchaeota archaeon]|jgi:hypothetical protein|nr:hypothetical protein [Candidatus Pacearchaeota archaeon]
MTKEEIESLATEFKVNTWNLNSLDNTGADYSQARWCLQFAEAWVGDPLGAALVYPIFREMLCKAGIM